MERPEQGDHSQPDQSRGDGLQPALHEAETELAQRLQEACEAEHVVGGDDTTGELIRLEETLLAAAQAAERAIALRRKLHEGGAAGAGADGAGTGEAGQEEAPPALREFRDRGGRDWRVWSVVPGQARTTKDPGRYLGEYAQGWLAFETLDGVGRRRIPSIPPDWSRRSDAELEQLLGQAAEVPRRGGRGGDAGAGEGPRA